MDHLKKLIWIIALLAGVQSADAQQQKLYLQLSPTPSYLANGGPGFVEIDANGIPFIGQAVPGSGTVTNAANLGNNAVVVGDGGGAGVKTVGGSVGGAITTSGAFTTTGAAGGTTLAFPTGGPFTFTYPGATSTLASLAGSETFTNKTYSGGILGGTFSGAFTLSGIPSLTGLSAGAQVACMGLNSSNQIVLLLAACGSGGSGTVTQNGNLTTHGYVVGGTNGTSDVKTTAAPTNGQIPIGSTGADPVPALPTAATPNITVAGSAGGLAFGTTAPGVDRSTANDAIVSGDATKLVKVGAHSYTIAQATGGLGAGWAACLVNTGSGDATITSTTSVFVGAGGTTTLVLHKQASACLRSNGTDYETQVANNLSAGTNVTLTYNNDGTITAASSGGGGGALTKIVTIDNTVPAASFDFTSGNLTGGNAYLYYRVDCTGIVSATGTPNLIATFNGDTFAAHYAWAQSYSQSAGGPGDNGSDSDTSILMTGSVSSTATIDLWVEFKNIAQTIKHKSINFGTTVDNTSSPHSSWANGGGSWLQNTAATEFTILMASGNIGGKCTLYGRSS